MGQELTDLHGEIVQGLITGDTDSVNERVGGVDLSDSASENILPKILPELVNRQSGVFL